MKHNDLMEITVGIFFLILGLAMFFYARNHYEVGELNQMGPGFFPSALGIIMAVLGGLISISGIGTSVKSRDFNYKPAALITLSIIAFALLIETIGALIAIAALVFISTATENKLNWRKKLILFIALFIIALLVFKVSLGMNFSLIKGVL